MISTLPQRPRVTHRTSCEAGFTLIELMVVLAVMGVVAALVLPGRLGGSDRAELRSATRAVAGGLERARSMALVSGAETLFAVDVERRRFTAPGDKEPQALPQRAEVVLRTVRDAVADATVGGIRFFPEGGSTGGGITLTEGGEGYRIAVDWLTGQVEISDAP